MDSSAKEPLIRSTSLDPKLLQRSPSFDSIREAKRQASLVKESVDLPQTAEVSRREPTVVEEDEPLIRSTSFDPTFLQRTPSFHSIQKVRLQASLIERSVYSPSTEAEVSRREPTGVEDDDTISEANADLSDINYSFQQSTKNGEGEEIADINELMDSPLTADVSRREPTIVEEDDTISEATADLSYVNCSFQQSTKNRDAEEIADIGGCIECVKAIPVFSHEEVEVGDHIVSAGAVYDHHGIVVNKNSDKSFEIVEATNTVSGAILGASKFFGGKAKIGSSAKSFDFAKQNIRVVEYRKRINSKSEVAKRAQAFAMGLSKEEKEKYKYNLFDNNCEHFATFCVTGKSFSVQVTKVRLTRRLFLMRGFKGISDELVRNERESENRIICRECYEMNKHILSVNIKPITCEADVQKGDIIRYSYWNLWHEAVVLDQTTINRNFVICRIVHYAFCGLFSHRTITEEDLKIKFDGKYMMLKYEPPKYNIYEPDIVVERARKRIGEKQFVFFSNDSSHFARWCKLKLQK